MNYYITGDTHGDFSRLHNFSQKLKLTSDDVIIILGDSGINYDTDNKYNKYLFDFLYSENNKSYLNDPFNGIIYKDSYISKANKKLLSFYDNIFFCIQGNHEARAENIEGYKEKVWNNGIVYYQEEYPNILFAKDGEIYDFNDKKVFVCGGAYSVDKKYRLLMGYHWYFNEQPDDIIKDRSERNLKKHDNKVDYILTHTCPLKYEPVEMFINGLDQSKVDKTTETWLNKIEENIDYDHWYCGHYHTNKDIDNLTFLFEEIRELNTKI